MKRTEWTTWSTNWTHEITH